MDISILVGGRAGDGIRQTGHLIARIFNRLNYFIFVHEDYQSLIKGGHNFSVIRVSSKKILCHKKSIDVLVAMDQNTVEKHKKNVVNNGITIFDSNAVKTDGIGIDMSRIVEERGYKRIMRNTVAVGALCKLFSIDLPIVEKTIENVYKKYLKENKELLHIGYESVNKSIMNVEYNNNRKKAILTGNEAISLGAVKAGMKVYIAYPMTPASSILHYLAAHQQKFNIIVVHPENEIAVANMAIGSAYAGKRAMVGTSGGGFALMTETVSLCGQSEIPVLFVVVQRSGPATGVPTYMMQGDLFFVLHAGHGEFARVVVAPGDAEEAYKLTASAMNIAWKFQIPAFVLSDREVAESTYTVEIDGKNSIKIEEPLLWDGNGEFKRYKITMNGVSPIAFPGINAVVRATSYEHDENGITTEDPEKVKKMVEKRKRKMEEVKKHLKEIECVNVYGESDSNTALVTWGSTKGVCIEVAEKLGLKVLQPLYLEPFPKEEFIKKLGDVEKIICVEVNSTAQLSRLLNANCINVHEKILKFDSRPFTLEHLEEKIKEVLK